MLNTQVVERAYSSTGNDHDIVAILQQANRVIDIVVLRQLLTITRFTKQRKAQQPIVRTIGAALPKRWWSNAKRRTQLLSSNGSCGKGLLDEL